MRKIILIFFAAFVCFFIIKKCFSPTRHDGIWENNKLTAGFAPTAIDEQVSEPETSDIYIDASGSMKPYFTSDGANMINTISSIKNLKTDETDIYFLNDPQPYKGLVARIISDVQKQPKEATTTFRVFFKRTANKVDTTNTIVYLVTDGIMSVGGIDTKKALKQLEGEITSALKGHKDLAGAVFRYIGEYKGNYANSLNQTITPAQCPLLKNEIERPYYIIALGQKKAIRWLQKTAKEKLSNPKAALFMGIHNYDGHTKYTLAKGDSAALQYPGDDVTLVLDLPECLSSTDLDVKVKNYDRELKVSVSKEDNSLVANIPANIGITGRYGKAKISFTAKNKIPNDWLTTWNTENDEKGPDKETTFGLASLVKGMFNGLDSEDNNLLSVDFIYKLK